MTTPGRVCSRMPVCLGCAWDRYRDQYDTTMVPNREWPTTDKTCHVCGMTTGMGYSVDVPMPDEPVRADDPDVILATGFPCAHCLSIRTTHYRDMDAICHDCGYTWGGEVTWLVCSCSPDNHEPTCPRGSA